MGHHLLARGMMIGAIAWVFSGGVASGFLYIVEEDLTLAGNVWIVLLSACLFMAVLCLLAALALWIGVINPGALWNRVLLGLAISFLVVPFGTIGLAYLLVAPVRIFSYLIGVVFISVVVWCWIVVSAFRRRIKDRRFIECEFSFEADRIVVRQPIKTNLEPDPINDKTLLGRLYHRFGPYLVMGIPLAYPTQRLLSDAGGTSAILLLLALLGFPLTLYILGRLACGAYLWIYKVWQLQRQHGKPVVFATSD